MKPTNILDIKIKPESLSVGYKTVEKPYLHHELMGIAETDESVWYLQEKKGSQGEKKEIVIELQKAQKGVRWGGVFKGHSSLNVLEEEELKKKMML